jgi:hypothetical protein
LLLPQEDAMPRRDIGNPKYTRACANPACGKEFQQRTATQVVCSVQCRGWLIAQSPNHSGGTRAKAGLKPRICANPACGKEFQPIRAKQTACSLECYRKTPARQQAQQGYEAERDRADYYKESDAKPERKARQNKRRQTPDANGVTPYRVTALRRRQATVAEFEAQLAAQGGVCALCDRPPKTGLRKDGGRMPSLHWDHDHKTGRRRKLLCSTCNTGLGMFRDDPVLLRAAAVYLEEFLAAVPERPGFENNPVLLRAAAAYVEELPAGA